MFVIIAVAAIAPRRFILLAMVPHLTSANLFNIPRPRRLVKAPQPLPAMGFKRTAADRSCRRSAAGSPRETGETPGKDGMWTRRAQAKPRPPYLILARYPGAAEPSAELSRQLSRWKCHSAVRPDEPVNPLPGRAGRQLPRTFEAHRSEIFPLQRRLPAAASRQPRICRYWPQVLGQIGRPVA